MDIDVPYWDRLLSGADRGKPPLIYMLHKLHKKHCQNCDKPTGKIDCLLSFFFNRDPYDDLIIDVDQLAGNRFVRLTMPS